MDCRNRSVARRAVGICSFGILPILWVLLAPSLLAQQNPDLCSYYNWLPIHVDASNATTWVSSMNEPHVSITICVPGTSNCQTIDNILLDTGSSGLRILKQALTIELPAVQSGGSPIGECQTFAKGGNAWGSVHNAAVILGGEPAVTVPIQVIDSSFGTTHLPCSNLLAGSSDVGGNGILGLSPLQSGGGGGYYICQSGSCTDDTAIVSAQKVQNPVFLLPTDNNGVLVYLDPVPEQGAPQASGELILGIGTAPNNDPTTLAANFNLFPQSPGAFATTYKGKVFGQSWIDTGSQALSFNDSSIKTCNGVGGASYCPDSPISLTATIASGASVKTVSFEVANHDALIGSGNTAFNDIAAAADLAGMSGNTFIWGLPFFYGRCVFLAYARTPFGDAPMWGYADCKIPPLNQPVIASMIPATGPFTGGTKVMVNGSGFDPGYHAVYGRNYPNTAFSVGGKLLPWDYTEGAYCLSSTQCQLNTPESDVIGSATVVASVLGVCNAGNAQFNYTGPTISSFDPPVGPITGGTPVIIHGTTLGSSKIQVSFGNVASPHWEGATPPYYSIDGPIVATSPAFTSPASVPITVSALGSSVSSGTMFTYEQFPRLVSINHYPWDDPGWFIQLNGFAPAGGAAIALTSSNHSVVPDQTVNVPAGASGSGFRLLFAHPLKQENVTLTATYQASSVSTAATFSPPPPPPLTITTTSARLEDGQSATCTVTLPLPAPSTGATVTLSSNEASLQLPPSVPIGAGNQVGTFSVTSQYSGSEKPATITATYGSTKAYATLQLDCQEPRKCLTGFRWNHDDCACERVGPPKCDPDTDNCIPCKGNTCQ